MKSANKMLWMINGHLMLSGFMNMQIIAAISSTKKNVVLSIHRLPIRTAEEDPFANIGVAHRQRYAKVANPYEHQDAFVCSTPSKKKIILNTAKNTKCMMIFINTFFMVVDFINYS